jgi:hypothetical protein
MGRPPFTHGALSSVALAAYVVTLGGCRTTQPSPQRDGLPVPTAPAQLKAALPDSAESSTATSDPASVALPSSAATPVALPTASVRAGACPEPPEVDPHDCVWGHWTAIPEEQERAAAWAGSDAARLWAGWCHPRPRSSDTKPERLWIPPKLEPSRGDVASTRQFLDLCSWWSPSPEPKPTGLRIVVIEVGAFDFGINIFDDGRAVFQSLRCERVTPSHVRMIAVTQVAALVAAFRAAKLTEHPACAQLIGDLDMTAVGLYSDDSAKLVRVNRDSPADAPIARLADLAERAAEAGAWVR